jgi:DNA-3-methyladenine glycosylase II
MKYTLIATLRTLAIFIYTEQMNADFLAALNHFTTVDPVLADCLRKALSHANPITMPRKASPNNYTFHLYSSILSQQISVKAADAILKRFLELVGDPHDANAILAHSTDDLKAIGLSRQKASYIRSIAELTKDGTVQIDHIDALADDEVIKELTKIKGVGVWTAEMFLIFTLARADVFSLGDLGLMNAVKKLYNDSSLTAEDVKNKSRAWSPYRTSAALALWHSLDNKPVN